jgi:hypothetical protein
MTDKKVDLIRWFEKAFPFTPEAVSDCSYGLFTWLSARQFILFGSPAALDLPILAANLYFDDLDTPESRILSRLRSYIGGQDSLCDYNGVLFSDLIVFVSGYGKRFAAPSSRQEKIRQIYFEVPYIAGRFTTAVQTSPQERKGRVIRI